VTDKGIMTENNGSETNVPVVQGNQNNDDRFVHEWVANLLSILMVLYLTKQRRSSSMDVVSFITT
jgi:hypothetical protein